VQDEELQKLVQSEKNLINPIKWKRAHTEIFSESCQSEPNLHCNYTFPTDLAQNSFAKVSLSEAYLKVYRKTVITIQIWIINICLCHDELISRNLAMIKLIGVVL